MKVVNTIEVYELDGHDTQLIDRPLLSVQSHWNREQFVVLEFSGARVTVSKDELSKAIENASNWKSYL